MDGLNGFNYMGSWMDWTFSIHFHGS